MTPGQKPLGLLRSSLVGVLASFHGASIESIAFDAANERAPGACVSEKLLQSAHFGNPYMVIP